MVSNRLIVAIDTSCIVPNLSATYIIDTPVRSFAQLFFHPLSEPRHFSNTKLPALRLFSSQVLDIRQSITDRLVVTVASTTRSLCPKIKDRDPARFFASGTFQIAVSKPGYLSFPKQVRPC